jgi:hypothetical protein
VNDEQDQDIQTTVPREQIGPFFLIGVEKDADGDQVEAHWARAVIAARKGRTAARLADINWAREILNEPEARARADLASLNVDTTDGELRKFVERFGRTEKGPPIWKPMDDEERPTDFVPTTAVPDPAEVRRHIVLPQVPADMPGAIEILMRLLEDPLDPWELELPSPNERV